MASATMNERQHVAQTTTSLPLSITAWVVRMLALLLFALLFSILIEWVGMMFWWQEQGVQHSRDMLEAEAQYLTRLQSSRNIVAEMVNTLMVGVMTGAETVLGWTMLEKLTVNSIDVVRQGAVSAINIFYVFTLRLTVLTLSLPTFLIFGVAGFVRGITGRELRRWGGGRESSGMFHLYKSLMPASFLGIWFLYLSMPVSINPFWLIGPAALFFAFLISGAVYRFKKYV